MSEGVSITFEAGSIGESSLRKALSDALVTKLHWKEASKGTRSGYGPFLLIGNAAKLVPTVEDARRTGVGVLALLGTDEDQEAIAALVELSSTSRLTLGVEPAPEARNAGRFLIPPLQRLAGRLASDRLRLAQYADGALVVVFGDGLAHSFDWRATKLLSRLRSVRPETAAVSEDFDSVVVLDDRDDEIDIDALALRRLVDASVAAESGAEFRAARARVGAKLRRLRETAGLSQEQLAVQAGLPQESISRLENGVRTPRLETLMKLATALRVPIDRLLRALEG